ncbi:MAG: GNAT family N-acetyltransferase [Oscillospiraceae bacterium]|jgi:predicted GNAT family acetyltransferase|nr:GNAT family N-acetyltransferase [Oscillospiraceae bacterium]
MRLKKYASPSEFKAAAFDALMTQEVQNNLLLMFAHTPDEQAAGWFLSVVYDENSAASLIAAMTPPHNIVLFAVDNAVNGDAICALVDYLRSSETTVPGVLAETKLAHSFAEAMGLDYATAHDQYIMQCDEVNPIKAAGGTFRPAETTDFYFLPYWSTAFSTECRLNEIECSLDYHISNTVRWGAAISDFTFLWEVDGKPVAMAKLARATENGIGVTCVYTPPMYRNKGYAQTLVAQASQLGLNRGKKFCFLFADADNPVSCGIYRKIGYHVVCKFAELRFAQ